MASIIQHLSLGILGDFEDLENVSEMVAETSKDQQSESATGESNTKRGSACAKSAASENNTCTCTCRICNLISAEKATFQDEK